MMCDYRLIPSPSDVGTVFKFIVYNKDGYLIGDFVREIDCWCADNIDDNSLYDVTETLLGCWVTVCDDDYAMAFKLRWL